MPRRYYSSAGTLPHKSPPGDWGSAYRDREREQELAPPGAPRPVHHTVVKTANSRGQVVTRLQLMQPKHPHLTPDVHR